MDCLELTIQTKEKYTEAISDFLDSAGAVSITWKSANEEALFEPDLDTTPLWQCVEVAALFPKNTLMPALMQSLHFQFDRKAILDCHFTLLPNKVWERVWLEDFKPMCFGKRVWVCPTCVDPPDPTGIIIRLDPGLAFGTGSHPSTALCLEWIDAQFQPGQTVIDYGCGSGILSIAALKCGAKKVFALDYDPQALEASQANALQNAISPERMVCLMPAQFMYDKKVDVLIANILAKPLMELAKIFRCLLKKEGQCILSGILSEQVPCVQHVYVEQGFTVLDVQHKEGWARIVFSLSP